MRLLGTIALVIILFAACEKDAPLPDPIEPSTLSEYLSRLPNERTSNDVWVHAGNHPAFEKATDQLPVHIRFFHPENAEDAVLFVNDSVQYPDSNELYRKTGKAAISESEGLFKLFALPEAKNNVSRWVRIVFQDGDTTRSSQRVLIRPQNTGLDTKGINSLQVETTPGGRAYMRWNGSASAANKNLVVMTDATGKAFCAVECSDPSFLFHDLRNVITDFTPALNNARLIEGETYGVRIFMTDGVGWIRNIGNAEFIADSNMVQSFD